LRAILIHDNDEMQHRVVANRLAQQSSLVELRNERRHRVLQKQRALLSN